MSLNTKIFASLTAELSSALDLASATSSLDKSLQISLTNGTTAGKADVLWHDQRTLAASASEDLDLAGSLSGILGGTVSFAKVKALLVAANAGNTNDVVVGNAASNGFVGPFGAAAHTVKVSPGGLLLMAAPGTAGLGSVTAGTGDLLHIANSSSGSAVTYQIVIVGTSA
ncbi:hypothetical protein [Actinomadura nitritigenes]|uniref:hypothetical protein n=1 Tax=Actinomadura nitritigenes TaxID=134602 RepID=UPI003D8B6532